MSNPPRPSLAHTDHYTRNLNPKISPPSDEDKCYWTSPCATPSGKLGKAHQISIPNDGTNVDGTGRITVAQNAQEEMLDGSGSLSPIRTSSLGLNYIRTRSNTSAPQVHSHPDSLITAKATPSHSPAEQEKSFIFGHTKSLKDPTIFSQELEVHHDNFSKEIHSPRFKAILRLTSGRRKRTPDIKSFSHELNSKGVRPYPCWKPRAVWHMEEVMVAVRAKFNGLKEEVDSDLSIFAGDVVGILEKSAEAHPEWKESLEDLLLISQKCAKMSPNEFWSKCENVVQTLDDRRQELAMGTIKQAHTRLLFILTRCTRLLQFQKESGYDEYHILGLHQLSDVGYYSAQIIGTAVQDSDEVLEVGEQTRRQGRAKTIKKHDHIVEPSSNEIDGLEVDTARSSESGASSFRMSSWKKLPSAAQRNHAKIPHAEESTSSDSPDLQQVLKSGGKDDSEPLLKASQKARRVNWVLQDEQLNTGFENVMICRICEVEIPTIYVEDHSRICTIVDRCDLKGLTVNERLQRIAEVLERIMGSWTLISMDTSPDVARVSSSNMNEELDYFSPKQEIMSSLGSDHMLDDTACSFDDRNMSPDVTMEMHALLMHDSESKTSSTGSMTPTSPLLAQTSQIELILSGRRTIYEHENFQQIMKLVEIVHFVANISKNDYSSLEYMLDSLEEVKYAIQDRKVDALVVETFGRRIEKLFQEKYVEVCRQIDDEKMDPTCCTIDEDYPNEDDIRRSPANQGSKERTCIEDFEIIKPISRGAFGRVFLARKRATGDLFAMKVLRKSDMIRKNAVESILAERNILISVRNPFVVRFFYSFTCRENLYLVMEYLNGGDLYSLLKNLGCLDEDMARIYIAEIVLALEYLHSLNIVHRDLKPDNLLIGPDGHIKLTDFGLSKVGLINSTEDLSGPSVNCFADDGASAESSKKEERQKYAVVGTPDYLAPEILLGMGHGATADWWSVGIILFEFLVGIPPFNAQNPQQIFDNIMNRDIPWPKIRQEMSWEAYDLITKLLMESPVQRLGATGAREVKQHPFFKDVNWDTLARQKATFVPLAEGVEDTSYFMSRYLWDSKDGQLFRGRGNFDDMTESSSSSSFANLDEDYDICGNVTEFGTAPPKYSFSNFSFKNLSQLASINYDLLVKRSMDVSKPFPQ